MYHHCSVNLVAVPSMERWSYCIHHHCSVNLQYPPWRGEVIVSTTIVLWTYCTLHGEVKLLYPPPLFCELTVPSMERWSYCIYHHWSVSLLYPPWRGEITVSTTIVLWTCCTLHEEVTTIVLSTHCTFHGEVKLLYLPPLIYGLHVTFVKMRIHCIYNHWSLTSLYPSSKGSAVAQW